MVEPLARVLDAYKEFGSGSSTMHALRGVSCEVFPEEQIALMGPSGSGKSTLLNLLAGLDTPTTGEVMWPALGPREDLRPAKISIVFQGQSLLPPLSVGENVTLPMLLKGIPEKEAASLAEQALERLHVADLRDKLPEEISGGQAQRVAMARALASRPVLLLADEPTGQLDSITGSEVIATLLDALHEMRAAAVVATHDPRVAERFTSHWEMASGHLEVGVQCST